MTACTETACPEAIYPEPGELTPPVAVGTDGPVGKLRARGVRLVGRLWNNVSLWSMFDQALFSGTNFLTVMLIGRFLSEADLGIYQMALTVVFLGYLIQEAVVVSPFRVLAARKAEKELPHYRGSLLSHMAIASTSAGLITGVGVLATWLGRGGLPYDGTFLALAASIPLLLVRDGLRRFALAELEPRRAALVDGIVAVVQLGGMAWFAPRADFSVAKTLAISGTASILAVAVLAVVWAPSLRFSWRAIGRDFAENWRFGRWTLASILVVNGGPLLLMPWLLTGLSGEDVAGEFAAGLALAGVTNVLLNGIGNVIGPKLARAYVAGGTQGLVAAASGFAWVLAITLGVATVGSFFFAEEAVRLVYGDKFEHAPTVFVLLMANALAMGGGLVAANTLWALNLPGRNFVADVIDMIVVLSLVPLLAPTTGAVGAAWAYLLGTIVATAVRIVLAVAGLRTAAAPPPPFGPAA